ncbi:hypothetical protein [Clostridium sp.]|uniref:hypothetical protein n=1 Tax=Clostridium sp. TaxID=1506 RepID=UPI001A508624|nr:hypothetical protein [Clostridium sp.]MBK5241045.1 hypothetical protein [Clostridium sp.]
MNNSKLSSVSMLKILGCFVFDIALVLAFFKTFGLFLIIDPVKSIIILFVLLIGLIILNIIVIFSDMLFMSIGIPYSASTVTLTVLYVIISNMLSIFLIPGSIVWHLFWQLIIFAAIILTFAVIAAFSNSAAKDIFSVKNEQAEKDFVTSQLLEIEDEFAAKENQGSIDQSVKTFKTLKERIQFSTPFGRITSNNEVSSAEKLINNNLVSLKASLKENTNDENLVQIQKLIEDTRRLVINREKLNIK